MKTSNQVFLIKIAYIFILILALAFNFSDMKSGFYDGLNGVEPNEKFTFLSAVFLFIGTIIGIAIIIHLYLFINSIQDNKVFTIVNIRRISSLGWFCALQSFLLYGFYFSKSDFSGLTYRSIVAVNFEFWLLIFGVTLLTIGFVFKKGIELQQEQELTI